MMLTTRHLVYSLTSIASLLVVVVSACLISSCDDKNTSSVDADYGTLRVRQLALSDAKGKTVVLVAAEYSATGTPVVVLRNPSGAVVRTIELEQKK